MNQSPVENRIAAPHVVVLAGPNGAGKSTAAPRLLRETLRIREFVNADVIAKGLSAFNPDAAGFAAGRILLTRVRELADARDNFAFETTLSSRSFAPWLSGLVETGYRFDLVFFWLPSADAAVARVAERVRSGGHDVPEETIRRRYQRGISNFLHLYRPLATKWRFYDNSGADGPRLIARGSGKDASRIADNRTWTGIVETYVNAT